ncbi:MAG: 2-C-methyl-D-erythritol 4-phosphate cytidylyltransferase [Solirubrobacteraceae bacterium]
MRSDSRASGGDAVALVVAAGSGTRLGARRPKALVELHGRTMLDWSVAALKAARSVGEIVVALPDGETAPAGTIGVRGGAVRSESVRNALAAAGEAELVLVHDAARPLLTPELVERVLSALSGGFDAAIAAAPVTDTIKREAARAAAVTGAVERRPDGAVREGTAERSAHPLVAETLRRSGLWAVQTPQAFRREALSAALAVGDDVLAEATDDAWLIERAGGAVALVASGAENLKITTPLDLELASLLLARRGEVGQRSCADGGG